MYMHFEQFQTTFYWFEGETLNIWMTEIMLIL